jgi:hypothetical protein
MTMAIDVRQPALHMTWEEDNLVLSLAPLQGRWTAEQYLLLTIEPSGTPNTGDTATTAPRRTI